MDSEKYWQAYEKGTAVASAADVARAALLAVGDLVSTAHADLIFTRGQLAELQNDPNRRGAVWTRSALAAEIARLDREVRRQEIYLTALRQHESQHQGELQRLAPQRESTMRVLDQMTAEIESTHAAATREVDPNGR